MIPKSMAMFFGHSMTHEFIAKASIAGPTTKSVSLKKQPVTDVTHLYRVKTKPLNPKTVRVPRIDYRKVDPKTEQYFTIMSSRCKIG